MAIKKVWIEDDCTACGVCVDLCPEIFSLPGDIAVVDENADFNKYEDCIVEAADNCPVEVIKYE